MLGFGTAIYLASVALTYHRCSTKKHLGRLVIHAGAEGKLSARHKSKESFSVQHPPRCKRYHPSILEVRAVHANSLLLVICAHATLDMLVALLKGTRECLWD